MIICGGTKKTNEQILPQYSGISTHSKELVLKCAGPKSILNIIYVLKNWRVGVKIKVIGPLS